MLLNTYTDSLDFNALTQWIDQALSSVMPAWGVVLTECILIGLCLLLGYALIALALVLVCGMTRIPQQPFWQNAMFSVYSVRFSLPRNIQIPSEVRFSDAAFSSEILRLISLISF